jgi:hypothetical protein
MNGIKALISSEKAIAAGVLVFISTLFVILGKMSVEQWNEYTLWALGIYTGGKTVTSVSTTVAAMNKPSVVEPSLSGGKTGGDIAVIVGGIGTSPKGGT